MALVKGAGRCRNLAGANTLHPGWGPCSDCELRAESLDTAREAQREALRYGEPVWVDPEAALVAELSRTNGAIMYLTAEIRKFQDEWGEHALWGRGTKDRPSGLALQEAYTAERDRIVRVAKACLDVGLEERRVRLAEMMGAYVNAAVLGVLERLGVESDTVPALVAGELRRLAETPPVEASGEWVA